MFVCNFKVTLKKYIIITVILFAAAAAVSIIIFLPSGSPADFATCDEIGEYSLSAETTAEQCDFLKQLGYTTEPSSKKSETVTIPSDFDSVYEKYNNLQLRCGLDLKKYAGRTAEKITYKINNAKAEYAVILVFEGRVIGGHLTSGEYGQEDLPLI